MSPDSTAWPERREPGKAPDKESGTEPGKAWRTERKDPRLWRAGMPAWQGTGPGKQSGTSVHMEPGMEPGKQSGKASRTERKDQRRLAGTPVWRTGSGMDTEQCWSQPGKPALFGKMARTARTGSHKLGP